MPAYLVAVYTYADRGTAEAELNDGVGATAQDWSGDVHDTPPVILAGLVRGGEYASVLEWSGGEAALCLASNGWVVTDWFDAGDAEARGALPFTWYRYATKEG